MNRIDEAPPFVRLLAFELKSIGVKSGSVPEGTALPHGAVVQGDGRGSSLGQAECPLVAGFCSRQVRLRPPVPAPEHRR